MPKGRTSPTANTIAIVIDGVKHSKPFDPSCALCQSPWLSQIDYQLATGLPYGVVIEFLRARRCRSPKPFEVQRHVAHLAQPHLQMRRQLEEAARRRGADVEGTDSLSTSDDIIEAMIRTGYERIASGEMTVSSTELIAVMRLKAQLDANAEGASDAQRWQAAFTALVEIAKGHLGGKWPDFIKDVYASEEIAAVAGYQVPPAVLSQGPVSARESAS